MSTFKLLPAIANGKAVRDRRHDGKMARAMNYAERSIETLKHRWATRKFSPAILAQCPTIRH